MIQSIRQFPNCQSIYREKQRKTERFDLIHTWSNVIVSVSVNINRISTPFDHQIRTIFSSLSMTKIFIVSFFILISMIDIDDQADGSACTHHWYSSTSSMLSSIDLLSCSVQWSSPYLIELMNNRLEKQIKSRHSFSHDDAIHRSIDRSIMIVFINRRNLPIDDITRLTRQYLSICSLLLHSCGWWWWWWLCESFK